VVRRLIEDYASYKPAYGDIRTEAVVGSRARSLRGDAGGLERRPPHPRLDPAHRHPRRAKCGSSNNGTDARIGEELVAAGIARDDIVLGFHPAELRPLTGYGVG